MERSKVMEYIEKYHHHVVPGDDESLYELAICNVVLGNYTEAQVQFGSSCQAMLENSRKFWKLIARTDWPVNTYILSGKKEFLPKVISELDSFKTLPSIGNAPYACSGYGMMNLLLSKSEELAQCIEVMLKRPRWKDLYALGQCFKAIDAGDQLAFETALGTLLKVHEGQARNGIYKFTAEGFVCMPAMSLAYIALTRNLSINIKNEKLSLGYVEFVFSNSSINT